MHKDDVQLQQPTVWMARTSGHRYGLELATQAEELDCRWVTMLLSNLPLVRVASDHFRICERWQLLTTSVTFDRNGAS